jgi:dCMP deaminase
MMDKDRIYMNIAHEIAKLSHCVSHKVGVILVKDGRILSTGINGTPKKFCNCDQVFNETDFDRMKHHKFSEDFEVHAEINAIIFAAENGISIKDSVMYSTLHPCNNCLKMICNSGIKKIYYDEEYDLFNKNENVDEMLKTCGIKLKKLD